MLLSILTHAEQYGLVVCRRQVRDIFRLFIDQQLADVPLTFCGLSHKLDYLIRQSDISSALSHQLYALQSRFVAYGRGKASQSAILNTPIAYDIKVLSQAISTVCGIAIPQALSALLPADNQPVKWGRIDTHCLRVIVDSWDDAYIYCHTPSAPDGLKVCYSAANRYLHRDNKDIDWTYLSLLLTQGCQLNLVYIRRLAGILYPEVIIYEPDLLIDITAITNCLTPYTDSPWANLISTLSQNLPSVHTELGNLASQFLDETVNHQSMTYAESLSRFFVRNAFKLATIDNLADSGFHAMAQQQRQNIRALIGQDLPKAQPNYNPDKILIEPSFYCPTLGLQGRMDMLQMDYKLLLEQKSGKAAFVPTRPGESSSQPPHPTDVHTLQLLLYRAVIHYGFKTKAENIEGLYLLYSKYQDGLVSLSPNSHLLWRGIRARNQMAWAWQFYARGGLKHLLSFTPEGLNTKNLRGRFWDEYVRPQITSVLAPLQTAPPRHQSYVLRMMTFVWRERLLSIATSRMDTSTRASLWQDTFDDKLKTGNILAPLHIAEIQTEEGIIVGLQLTFGSDDDFSNSNFRIGDIAILYAYSPKSNPDPCRGIVFRTTIDHLDSRSVVLKLRDAQANPRIFGYRRLKNGSYQPTRQCQRLWAIEHDHVDGTASLLRSIYSILMTTPNRRALLLGERRPEIAKNYTLRGYYGDFAPLVHQAMRARDYFLLIGPPGTGKTSYGLMSILKEELQSESSTVLLSAYTNRAVDEICGKLCETQMDFVRLGPEQSCAKAYRQHLVSRMLAATRTLDDARHLLTRTRIVCATTTSLTRNPELFRLKHFTLAIIDEASQILEPQIIGILSALDSNGEPAIDRFVLIGDHKQLPAVTRQSHADSVTEDELLHQIGLIDCQDSLFERLLRCQGIYNSTEQPHDEAYGGRSNAVYMLQRQGRMHPVIADFASKAFYAGKLTAVPLPHQLCERWQGCGDDDERIIFVDVRPTDRDLVMDKCNISEAHAISRIVYQTYKNNKPHFDPDFTIGVIVPYRNQIALVRKAIAKYKVKCLADITIDTVERFQGSQREVIVYGFTVTKAHQLNFLTSQSFIEDGQVIDRKLNVAITRARQRLYLIGNAVLLSRIPLFKQLIDYATSSVLLRYRSNIYFLT